MGSLDRWFALGVAVGLIAVGYCVAYLIHGRQVETIVERAAAPVWHDDGSVTAIRAPKAKPDLPAPSKPAGGRPVRTLEATIKPATPDCPPVAVRVDLDEYDDGLRASFVADGGEVVDAVDIPRAPYIRPIARPWAVGIEYTPETDRYGLAMDRDVGNIRLGASVDEDSARVRVQWKIK